MALTELFDADFPDPAVLISDGDIYLYGTNLHGAEPNLQLRRASSWHGPWEDLGHALTQKNCDAASSLFWAPSNILQVGSEYRLYYTAETPEGLGICVAKSDKPTDFTSAERHIIAGAGYAVIDPHVISHDGSDWLYWGSMHQPVRCQRLDPSGERFAEGSTPFIVLEPGRGSYETLIEGFYLEYHEELDTWYAFVSGNNTWKADDYAVTTYRSKSPFGPFERCGVIAEPNDRWWAPGQNSICKVGNDWFFVCHAVKPDDPQHPNDPQFFKRVPVAARMQFDEDGVPFLAPL